MRKTPKQNPKPKPEGNLIRKSILRARYRKAETKLSFRGWVRENAESLLENFVEKFDGKDLTISVPAGKLLGT